MIKFLGAFVIIKIICLPTGKINEQISTFTQWYTIISIKFKTTDTSNMNQSQKHFKWKKTEMKIIKTHLNVIIKKIKIVYEGRNSTFAHGTQFY